MASIAVVGNLLVLLGRYFYKSRSNVEHSLYLRHLAASDFLMGIYLTLIACADINFRGQYIRHEESWRHSSLCAFAGKYFPPHSLSLSSHPTLMPLHLHRLQAS